MALVSHWNLLPVELRYLIFDNLPGNDLLRLQFINKEMQFLVNDYIVYGKRVIEIRNMDMIEYMEQKKWCYYLNLENVKPTGLDRLQNSNYIQALYINEPNTERLELLQDLITLKALLVYNNPFHTMKWLDRFANLQELHLCNAAIKKIEGFENCALKKLVLSNNNITTIEGLENCTQLEYINLSFNQITAITGLENCTRLKTLVLYQCEIEVITGLENATCLQTLILGDNSITAISGLENCTRLRDLGLNNNPITQITGLENCTRLETLDLNGTYVASFDGLENCTRLRELYIINAPVEETDIPEKYQRIIRRYNNV